MNSATKEEIKKRLKKDALVVDLTDFQTLNEDTLNYILKRLEKSSLNSNSSSAASSTNTTFLCSTFNIGSIKWNTKSCLSLNSKCKKIIEKIETYLIRNNESFTMFPSDYIHCLLTSHCYSYSPKLSNQTGTGTIGRSNGSFMFLSRFSTSNMDMNTEDDLRVDSKWKLLRDDWKIFETFHEKDYKSVLYLNDKKSQMVLAFQATIKLDSINKTDLVTQILYSYMHTKRAVLLAEQKGYLISFTGYSIGGASLAEISAYFCNTFSTSVIYKAVTFESFGTFLDSSDENVVSYFTNPNFINTYGQRSAHSFSFEQSDRKTSQYYSSGVKSLTTAGLDLILKELSTENSKPLKRIIQWPKTELNTKTTDTSSFDFDKAFYSVSFNIDSTPKEIKTLASTCLNLIPKQTIQTIVDHLFKCYSLINVIKSLNEYSFSDYFLDNKTKSNQLSNDSELTVDLVFKLDDANLKKTRISITNNDYLLKLIRFNSFDFVQEDFLARQLNTLKSLYKITLNFETGYYIESSIEINRLRDRLYRYLSIEPNLKIHLDSAYSEITARNTICSISRENDLLNIENILKTEQFCCLFGPIGVGKSTIARQYHLNKQSKSKMQWIDADCVEKITLNFMLFLSDLNIQMESNNRLEFFTKLKLDLNSYSLRNKTKFLFIIDNLIDEQDIELLKTGFDETNIKFIITTSKHLSDDFKISRVEIKLPSKEECFKSLEPKYHNIVNKLQDLSLIKYSRLISIQNDIVIDNKSSNLSYSNLIKQECLKASDFLSCLTFLDGNYNITLDLIRTLFIDEQVNDFSEALNYLIKGNLIINDFNRYAIHSLIQNEIIAESSQSSRKNFILDRIVLALNTSLDFKYIETKDLKHIEIAFKQAIKILKEDWKTKCKNLNCAELFYKIGLIYDNILFEYKEALANYKESLRIHKNGNPVNHLKIDNVLDRIANDYMRLDLNEEAVSVYKEILLSKKTSTTMNILASVYEKLKQNDYALLNYKESLDLLLKQIPSVEILEEISNTYSKIANIHLKQKSYQDALYNFKQVLQIRKETLVSNHPSISKCLTDIGSINYNLGKYEDALKVYKDALRIDKEILPENHADIANISNVIGNIHFNMGQMDEAFKVYKEAMRIKRETGNQASMAMILNNIGLVLNRMDKYAEALTNFKESLAIKKEHLSENHLSIANTLNNIGNAYFKLNQTDESLKHYNEAFKIFSETSPCNYSKKADTLANIGVVYKCLGQHDLALENYQEVLKIRREKTLLSNQHPSVAKTLNNIGNVYFQMGKDDEALANYKESLRIYKETLPSNHFSIANTLFNIDIVSKE